MTEVPPSPSGPARRRANEAGSSLPGDGITILLADDDEILRELFSTVLRDLGYRVCTAPDGEAAMRTVNAAGGPKIDLLLTDYQMPFMQGDELALRFRQANPTAAIIVMSGESPELSPTLRCKFIAKPFPIHKLGEMVKAALDARTAA